MKKKQEIRKKANTKNEEENEEAPFELQLM